MRPRLNQKPYYTHLDKNTRVFSWEAHPYSVQLNHYPDEVGKDMYSEYPTENGLHVTYGYFLIEKAFYGQVKGKETLDLSCYCSVFYEGTTDREVLWVSGEDSVPCETLSFEGCLE